MQGIDIVHEGNIRHVVVDAYSAACQIVSGTPSGDRIGEGVLAALAWGFLRW